jgi:hypothetical protein
MKTPTSPLVHVIVLNWCRPTATTRCLRSLEQLTYEPRELVVVDNGSDDDSEELLASLWPDLRLIQTGSNLGYAGGNNWGIRHALEAGADYVWVLNNDTVVEPGTLSQAVAAMEARPAVGAVATRLVELESGRTAEDAFTTDGHTMSPVLCDGCDLGWHAAEVLGGPSLLLRAAALREVGLFDEEYFHYYEEADLMERMRRHGWELGLACRAPIHHEHGGSLSYASPQSQYYVLRNALLYRRKLFGEHPLHFIARHPRLVRNALGLRHAVRQRDTRASRAALLALVDAVRNRTGRRDLGSDYQGELEGLIAYSPTAEALSTSS